MLSMTLIRTVFKDCLVGYDYVDHTETADSFFEGDIRATRFKDMSNRLPEDLRSQWEGLGYKNHGGYGLLSTFAHPRGETLATLVHPENSWLALGPKYNKFGS